LFSHKKLEIMVWPIHLVPRPPTNHTIVHVSWLSFLSICSILPFFWWYTKSFDNLKLGDGDYSSSSFALVSLFFSWKTCRSHFGDDACDRKCFCFKSTINSGLIHLLITQIVITWYLNGTLPPIFHSQGFINPGLTFFDGSGSPFSVRFI
jgi:hypothetical protein